MARDTATHNREALFLGAASRTINPPANMQLIGYPNPDRRSVGVDLDLCARAVALGTGDDAPVAGIVILDVLGIIPRFVERIRQAVTARIPGLPPQSILVAATHTHSAPGSTLGRTLPDQPDEQYVDEVVEHAAAALATAWQDRAPVRMRVGLTEAYLGHNRRVVDAQGQAVNDWLDEEGRHTGFFNPILRFLVFEHAQTGKPRAVLSSYGCHPVTRGMYSYEVSADYPGYFCRAVEAALPGCTAVHMTGAAANINPRLAQAEDSRYAKIVGPALADALLGELPYADRRPRRRCGSGAIISRCRWGPTRNAASRPRPGFDGRQDD